MPKISFFAGVEIIIMLKEAIIEVIHESLSDYFETLDTSQLSISLWAGDVVLHDLKIKATAIEGSTALPVKVVAGKIGKLNIKIPWASLFRSSVEIYITELYVLLIPSYAEYDKETEEKIALIIKKNIVQRFEDSYKEYVVRQRSGESDDSYTTKLAVQIFRNLQIQLESIHIRYEDNVTQDVPVSIGFLLNSFSMHATDENWQPVFIYQVMDTLFKKGSLEGFSCYWNIKSNLISSDVSSKDSIIQQLNDLLTDGTGLSHVIGPVKAEMNLTYTADTEKTEFRFPQIIAVVIFSELALGINQTQLKDGLKIADTLKFITRSQHYKQYKPITLNTYRGNYKKWWKFAYHCTLEQIRRRRNNWKWKHIKTHRNIVKMYMEVYQKMLTSKVSVKEITDEVSGLEQSLDVFNIILARKLVQFRIKRLERAEASRKPSWLMSFFSNNRLSTEEANKIITDNWTPEEKLQLKELLDFKQGRNNPVNYPEDYEILNINFRINNLLLTLFELASNPSSHNEDEDVVLRLKVLDWGTQISRRPVNDGLKFDLTLGSVEAEGVHGQIISNCPKDLQSEPSTNVLDFTFENKPVSSMVDRKIKLVVQPLQLVYHYPTIQKLLDRFVSPQIGQPDTIAATKLEELKEFSASKFQLFIKNRAKTEVIVDCLAPYILIPRDGDMKKSSTILGVDLGKLTIKSESGRIIGDEMKQEAENDKSFETYNVELRDFQVFLALPGELYEYQSLTKTNQVVSYEKMVLTVKNSRLRKSHLIPSLKFEANIPVVNIDIGQQRFLEIVLLLIKLPLPHINKSQNASAQSASKGQLAGGTRVVNASSSNSIKSSYNDSRIFSESEEKDQLQFVDIAVDARVNSIQIKLNQDEKKLLTLLIKNLTAKVVSMTFSDEFEFTTDSVTLSILGHKIPGRKGPLYLIYTVNMDKTEPPLKMRLSSVSRACPNKYLPSAVDAFSCQLSEVVFIFHQEALSTLLKFIDGFQNAELHNTLEELQLPARKNEPLACEKIEVKLRIQVQLERLTIHVAADTKNIAKFILQGFKGKIEETLSSLTFELNLSQLEGYPTETSSPYQKILIVEGGKAIESRINVNKHFEDNSSGPRTRQQHDIFVHIKTGSMFAIIVPQIIQDVKEFSGTFSKHEINREMNESQQSEFKEVPEKSVQRNSKKILLNIQIEPPRFAFPKTASSVDAILVNLGKLSFVNEFVSIQTKSKETIIVDQIDFQLHKAKISRIFINFDNQAVSSEVYLLNPISFQCKVARNLSCCVEDLPKTKVVIRLHNNILRMDIEDYRLWRNIFRNFATPVLKRHTDWAEKKSGEIPDLSKPQPCSSSAISVACEELAVEVFLQHLEVFLYDKAVSLDEHQGVVFRDQEDSFAFFSLIEIKGTCKIWSNADFCATLTVGDLIVEDTRNAAGNSMGKNKTIVVRNPPYIAGQLGSDNRPFFKITYANGKSCDTKEAKTTLELPAISVNMFSEFLSKVHRFFTVDY